MMASYYSSHFSPKCHLAGMPRLAWDASTGPHLIPERVCGFEVTDWWYPKFCICSPKNQEYFPAQEPTKTPPWHPPSAISLCMRAARQHCKEECQAVLYLWFLQEPCLEEHLAFIFQAVWVQPTQPLCQFKGLPVVSPFLLSLHQSLVFPECCNPTTGYCLPSKHKVLALPCQLSMLNAKNNPKSLYWAWVPMNL